MATTSELYAQSEISKKLIEEIANDIKAAAERLYSDMNNSPHHAQQKADFHETATWQTDHITPKIVTSATLVSSATLDPLHKVSDEAVVQKFISPVATLSEPYHKQGEILSKPISGHIRSPSAHDANKKFDELIAKADLIISRSPRRDNYPSKNEIKAVPFDFSNLKTLPKSPVVASAFTETYNSSAKPGHTRHVSSTHEELKIGDYLSGTDVHKVKTEYQPTQITLTVPKDYKEEYKSSANTLVSAHEYKSTPVYTDKIGTYQYETSVQKHLDAYKPIEPKKEITYNFGSASNQEKKYYDHGKLDAVLSNIAKRKGLSPEALKSSPKPNLKIVTETNNPTYYYPGHHNLPEYIDHPAEIVTQPATISLDNYKLSSQLHQYEGLYSSNKPVHAEYGVDTLAAKKLKDPYDLSLSKLVERVTLESGYSSAMVRDDYSSVLLESKAPKKTLGYEPRSARSPERSIIERVEALENDLDSLYLDIKGTVPGTHQGLERPVQSFGGYQGLYKGRNDEFGHEIETRHKSPYGNEGLVYVRDLDKRRLHQGESNQGGVHVSNKERFMDEEARGVRREGNTWRDEDRYRIQITPAQPSAQRERSYDPIGYGERREELARKSYERRNLTPESYRREYGDNVNRYSPQRSNLRSPIRYYTNKTEQVTPTKSGGSRQDSGQKGTNKIEKAFIF